MCRHSWSNSHRCNCSLCSARKTCFDEKHWQYHKAKVILYKILTKVATKTITCVMLNEFSHAKTVSRILYILIFAFQPGDSWCPWTSQSRCKWKKFNGELLLPYMCYKLDVENLVTLYSTLHAFLRNNELISTKHDVKYFTTNHNSHWWLL